MPGWLIELETPHTKVLRTDGDLTAHANHACQQIGDWVRVIDRNPRLNAAGEFDFLLGDKQRLVVIGRGLEHRKRLLEMRYRDTAMWTYDLLLEQARKR